MDSYFLKDHKTANQRLNEDLDSYFNQKPVAAEAQAEEAAPAGEEAAAQ